MLGDVSVDVSVCSFVYYKSIVYILRCVDRSTHTHVHIHLYYACVCMVSVCVCMCGMSESGLHLWSQGDLLWCVAHMKRLIPPANHTTGQPKVSQRLHSCTRLAPLGWISKGMFSQWARPSLLFVRCVCVCVCVLCMHVSMHSPHVYMSICVHAWLLSSEVVLCSSCTQKYS